MVGIVTRFILGGRGDKSVPRGMVENDSTNEAHPFQLVVPIFQREFYFFSLIPLIS